MEYYDLIFRDILCFPGFGGKNNSATKSPIHETTKYHALQSRSNEGK
jgi:hypothetical protein